MLSKKFSLYPELIQRANDIMRAAQLAACLEVSGYPKPGNVHRLRDFKDTTFEHFIAGSIAIGPSIREASIRGMKIGLKELELKDANIGFFVKKAVSDVKVWHKGGNTHLGIITLFIPLAVSAGYCTILYGKPYHKELKSLFKDVVKATTYRDTIEFYNAIKIANPGGLGKIEEDKNIDVTEGKIEILEEKVTLYDVMRIASEWDMVAWEFVNGLETVFYVGCPTFEKFYKETGNVNIATVHTFLKLLSLKPDTLIARKIGLRKTSNIREAVKIGLKEARKYSFKARKILELGGLKTRQGKIALKKLDKELTSKNVNPGSTADILATSLFLAIMKGFRP